MHRFKPDIIIGKVILDNGATFQCPAIYLKTKRGRVLEVVNTSVGKSLEYFGWKMVKVSGRVKKGKRGKEFLWVDKILTIDPLDSLENPFQMQA